MTAADFFVDDRADVPAPSPPLRDGSAQGEATLLTRDGREIPPI